MATTILYVHGAGQQQPGEQLKQALDEALFPGRQPITSIAYYSDICWPVRTQDLDPGASGGAKNRAPGLSAAIEAAAIGSVSRHEAARKVVAAMQPAPMVGPSAVRSIEATEGRRSSSTSSAIDAGAVQLMEVFYQGADQAAMASQSSSTPGPLPPGAARELPDGEAAAEFIALPDPIFRLAAGKAGADVVRYLYQPDWARRMRTRVRDAFAGTTDPFIVVAHSLGTIITYDVMSDPEFARRDIRLLATIGSPLGIANVMMRLRDGVGPGTAPSEIQSWSNFCDRLDPVAILGQTLSDKFAPFDFVHDVTHLDNPASDNHALTEYLALAPIREAVGRALRLR